MTKQLAGNQGHRLTFAKRVGVVSIDIILPDEKVWVVGGGGGSSS